MNTTKRFNQAIEKLYNAFHNNTLNPECCNQCAVGNILDNTDAWKHLSNFHGATQLNYLGLVHQNLDRKFNGYSPIELLQIEATFLKACGYTLPLHHTHKKPKRTPENLFNGLEAVVKLLCQLDNLPNVMDCSILFNYKSEKSSLLLETIQ
ncbi:MAG: Na(+)-translocating NADH-quinone reductase subunit F [Flavobacterium haoranii]